MNSNAAPRRKGSTATASAAGPAAARAGAPKAATGRAAAAKGGSRLSVASLPALGSGDDDESALVLRQFRVIFRSVKKHFQVIERSCGVGGSQLWALATIVEHPGIRVSELAKALSIHQSTASNLIEQMVRLGLITRVRDDEDQRVVRLQPTDRGAALLERAPQPLIGVLPDALSHLDPAAVAQLRESLDKLLKVMKVRDESATFTPLADL